MNLFSGAIGGAIGGVIGAAIWAAIAYFAQVEVGYVAWAIGGLVGFGSAVGTKGGSATAGLIAVLITIAAICAGKYIAIQLALSGEVNAALNAQGPPSDEFCISLLADEICEQKELAGETIQWPVGRSETPEKKSDYPQEIWTEAAARWAGFDEPGRKKFIEEFVQNRDRAIQAMRGQIANRAFFASFGPIDIIFFLLAIVTAWKLAASDQSPAQPAPPPAQV